MSKKPKVVESTTPFQSIKSYQYQNEGFGGANAQRVGSALNVSANLGELRPTYDLAQTGLNSGLGAINTPFEQQLAGIQGGNNAFYNYQNELLNRNYKTDVSDATARYARSGLENSTTRGAFEAGLASNRNLNDLALQDQALRFINDANRANVATNAGILDQLYTYQNNPSQLASNSIMTGLQSIANNNQLNAQAQNQANLQAAQSRNALIGNIIGSVGGLAATALTGGLAAPLMGAGGLGALAGRSAASLASRAALGGLQRGIG